MTQSKDTSAEKEKSKESKELKDIFSEYTESIRSVADAVNVPLPSISFVFTDINKAGSIYFVSPGMARISKGDFAGPISELERGYSRDRYKLLYIMAVFPGMMLNGDKPINEFYLYGGMDVNSMDVVWFTDPESMDQGEKEAQFLAMKTLLANLRTEYIVQYSMNQIVI